MTLTPYYSDNLVTLYHGDALEVLAELDTDSIDVVVTDPPYVIGAVSAGNLASKSGGWADMMNSAHWFTSWYREVERLLIEDGAFWSFLNWRTLPVVMRAATDARLPITSLLVWDKEWIGPGGSQGLRPSYELVALMARPEFSIPDRSTPDIWRCKTGGHKPSGHPAEKPVRLVERIISAGGSGPDDGPVLDPFAGSGTTLLAARQLGIPSIGIEADERWCELIVSRLGGPLRGDLATGTLFEGAT